MSVRKIYVFEYCVHYLIIHQFWTYYYVNPIWNGIQKTIFYLHRVFVLSNRLCLDFLNNTTALIIHSFNMHSAATGWW